MMRKSFAVAVGLLSLLGTSPLPAKPKHKHKDLIEVLWRDPGDVGQKDLANGPGGSAKAPRPPFRFVEEDMAGTNPKVKVKDANGDEWEVKWGPEAFASPFSSHLAWSCGYFVETEYFVPNGVVSGVRKLKRAGSSLKQDGTFHDARFQLRAKEPKFIKDSNWTWTNNPFLGTPQFNGLRVLMMLVSNWDAKDARNFGEDGAGHGRADSNLAIFETEHPKEYLYFVSDWGATLGKWSPVPLLRTKWDSKGFSSQNQDLVKGVQNGEVQWGYAGTHGADITKGIRVTDVQWLMRYLGQLTDAQIRRGLAASGAAGEDLELYARALRERIQALDRIARTGS